MREKTSPRRPEPTQVLLVGGTARDREYLRLLFPVPEWRVRFVGSVRQAGRRMASRSIRVVLTDHDLPDGRWNDVVEIAAASAAPPPVIVSAPDADERMWADVLSFGGYDVLLKPFEPAEVRRVVGMALRRTVAADAQVAGTARAAS